MRDAKRILHLVNTSDMNTFMAENFASEPEEQKDVFEPVAVEKVEIDDDSDDDFYMVDHYAESIGDDSESESPDAPPSEDLVSPAPIITPAPPPDKSMKNAQANQVIKNIGKSTQKTLAKLGFGDFPMPETMKKTQTVGDVFHGGSYEEEEVLAAPMEKYNSAPPIHIQNKEFSISANELNWSTWQENDDMSKLPSFAIQYYEEVRHNKNVSFQGVLHKRGQQNKEWKVRMFSINPDKDFFIRYFLEDSKLEPGYERGTIDVEDIIDIETRPADKEGYILILIKTAHRMFHLSTQNSEVAGTFIGVVQNVKDIITEHISKKLKSDMARHKGKVLIKGWMQKMGKVHRTWKRRFFVLDTNRDYSIRYYEKEDTTMKPRGIIDLVHVNFIQNTQNDSVLKSNPYSFDCITNDRTFHIAAESSEQRDQWVSILGEVIGQDLDHPPESQPIHKGIVQRHGESQRRNLVGKAFMGLSRRVKKAMKDVEGFLVLFPEKVTYFNSPKRFDMWTRMQLMKGGSEAFEFEAEEVEIDLMLATLHRVTGFGEGKDRFALIENDTRYICNQLLGL